MRKEEAVKNEKMFGSLLKDSDSKIEIQDSKIEMGE